MFRFEKGTRANRHAPIYAAAMAIALMAACAKIQPRLPQTQGPVAASRVPGPITIAGRSVCIDPGHGGPWPGAVSPHNQLREADVNLAVGLRLKELLVKAGIHVSITRESDAALLPEGLSQDLSARAAFANVSGADIFVSIHHNADIKMETTKNDLEVYYKLGDDGPSLDLAQQLITHLAGDVRKDDAPKRLLPGNYKVLRECNLPCVLLETSYVTEAHNAERMASPEGIEAEARSIAAGIVAYFQADPPKGVRAYDFAESDWGLYSAHLGVEEGGPVDPGTVACFVDGTACTGRANTTHSGAEWNFLSPLENGDHAIEFRFRNTKGMAAITETSIRVDRKPEALLIEQIPAKLPNAGMSEFLLVARPVDAFGFAIADGVQVRLTQLGKSSVCRDGKALFYLPANAAKAQLHFECEGISSNYDIPFGDEKWVHVNLLDGITKSAVAGVHAILDGNVVCESTNDGWIALPRRNGILLVRDGYTDTKAGTPADGTTLALKPVSKGVLIDRRIVIDPAHGGRDPGLVAPSGLRGSDTNLDVARRLAALLKKAGAHVLLTRDGDVERTEPERVLDAERFRPDVFLTISFGSAESALRVLDSDGHQITGESSFVAHYPGSANGERLAKSIADELHIGATHPCVSYPVQQMSCPAVLVYPQSIATPNGEVPLGRVEARIKMASEMAEGLAQWFEQIPSK